MAVPIVDRPPASPDDDVDVEPDRRETSGTSRWQKVVGIVGFLVVLWVGNEMYDVVFFDGTFGGGQHTPAEDQDQEQDEEIDTDDDGGHTPPPGGHG